MKAASFPPKKAASESSNGFQNPRPRRLASRPGGNFRVVAGEASRNNRTICQRSFRPYRTAARSSLHRHPHTRTPSTQAASPFSILRSTSTTAWTRTGEQSKSSISGTVPEKIPNSKVRSGQRSTFCWRETRQPWAEPTGGVRASIIYPWRDECRSTSGPF
jgi:hypothetical protein